MKKCHAVVGLALFMFLSTAARAQPTVDLRGLPVVVADDATAKVRAAADELADYLGRIVGSPFAVTTSGASRSIRVGRFDSFDPPIAPQRFDAQDPTRREEYFLHTSAQGLDVVAATDDAVSHAVWDLLYRLGHRQYMPGERWEIIPSRDSAVVAFDVFASPDFINRRIVNGGGYFKYDKDLSAQWGRRNRLGNSFKVATSHFYDYIVIVNEAEFEKHPEWFALRDGKREPMVRTGNKFCISNPALREFVANYAITYVEQKKVVDGISMDPSDGDGWCECEPCKAMGNITDRVVTLANQVATTLNDHFDQPMYVGYLAYGSHSPPPNIALHPNTVVTVTKGYLRGGYTFEQLLEIWGNLGAIMGTYDYLGVVQWSWDRPGIGRSARRNHAKTLVPLRASGVRVYLAEAEGNWGPAGPNYYFIARTLWDVKEADRIDAMFDQFIADCFPNCADDARKFYDLINGDNQPLLSHDLIGRMFAALDRARSKSITDAERARLDSLVVYARYVDLYFAYRQASGDERQADFEKLMRYIWRTRDHLMVHTREIYRQLHRIDKRVSMPDNATYRTRESENPWQDSTPVTAAEFDAWVAEGIARNPMQAFEPITFSRDLVPATPLGLTTELQGDFGQGTQGFQLFYTWFDQPDSVDLTVTGGLIRHYRDRGDARIKLYGADDAEEHITDEGAVPPDGEPRQVKLTTQARGLHRIEVNDGGDRTKVDWPEGVPMTFISDATTRISYPIAYTLYFYVPKGTKRVAGYSDNPQGDMRDSDNNIVFIFKSMDGAGYFDVPVPEGQDGKLWMLRKCQSRKLLMTVPPSLARSADELLLPAEVVARDKP